MKNMNKRTLFVASLILLNVILLNSTVTSHTFQDNRHQEFITFHMTDMLANTKTEKQITTEVFIELFTQRERPNTINEFIVFYKKKIDILSENDLIAPETETIIRDHLINTAIKSPHTQGALFDVINLFNGIFFALKGEKTASFLDLPVLKFPFFNENITALFSGFSKYEGNGFIFTLGTLGFQYAYDYDTVAYEFPHFPPIKGSIIGFTGVLLEADVQDTFGEQYEGFYSIGIGMNIFTLWNKQ